MSLWNWLLNPTGLTAHGFCLSWTPGLIMLHAGSDAAIALAYFSIPLAIAVVVRRRPHFEFRWVANLFVAFILACGATHLMSILTLWVPAYGVEGIIKAITAGLSIATAVLMWPLIPKILAVPSQDQLRALNQELSDRIADQERTAQLLRETEAGVRLANSALETRVAERAAALEVANAELTAALGANTVAQQALARSEAEFRASFEGASVGKTLSEPQSRRLIRVNQAFARMLGYEPEELIGHTSAEFNWAEDQVSDTAEYARLLSGEIESYVYEKRYRRRDGTPFWVRVSAALARAPDSGHPVLTVASIEDVDARYEAEAELRAAKHALEDIVEERSAALAQRDLLLREVYHRVKNNLQIVDSLVVLQSRRISDPAAVEAMNALRNRIYALGLVHQQLMESSDLRTFDIAPFLHELSSNILEGGSSGDVALTVDACTLEVGLDFAIPLGLLVTELLNNSLKHAFPDHRGAVSVELRPDEGGEVVLVVSDNGLGLPADDADDAAVAGLGQRIVAGLVAQLQATMVVDGEGGLRTEIRIARPPIA